MASSLESFNPFRVLQYDRRRTAVGITPARA